MLIIFSLALLPLAYGALPSKIESHPLAEYFKTWKSNYHREYETIAEEVSRFEIWVRNMDKVRRHNMEFEMGLTSFTMEMNSFADLTEEEFGAMYLGSTKAIRRVPDVGFSATGSLPDNVDWRTQGYVTPIKDQGQCGSCWSFSATGSFEGQHFNATGDLVSLSEQQLVDCDFTSLGCNGGNTEFAFNYLIRHGGSNSEADYPYTAQRGLCKAGEYPIVATMSSHVQLPFGNEDILQEKCANVGPISVAIDASQTSFQLYKSGVYYEPRCSSFFLDHAVLVVGYGEYQGQDYWLVKNSWGTSWGMDGYIMMARNENNNCGIASEALYPVV